MAERAVLTRVFVAAVWLRVCVSNPLRDRIYSLLIHRQGQAKICMLIEHLCMPTCIHRVNKRCKDQGQREYYGYWACDSFHGSKNRSQLFNNNFGELGCVIFCDVRDRNSNLTRYSLVNFRDFAIWLSNQAWLAFVGVFANRTI